MLSLYLWFAGALGSLVFLSKFDNVVIESHKGFLYSCSIYNSYVYYAKLLIVLWSHTLCEANQVAGGLANIGLSLDKSTRMFYFGLRSISMLISQLFSSPLVFSFPCVGV
jgi:hypothetical protein